MKKGLAEFSGELAQNLAILRDMSTRAVSDVSGMSEEAVRQIFRGRSKPIKENAERLAKALNVDIEDLKNCGKNSRRVVTALEAKDRLIRLLNASQLEKVIEYAAGFEEMVKRMEQSGKAAEPLVDDASKVGAPAPKFNILGQILLGDFQKNMETIGYLTREFSDLTVEIDVGFLIPEDDEEGTLFVRLSPWCNRIFGLEAIHEIPFYPEDPNNWEEDAMEATGDYFVTEIASGMENEMSDLFVALIDNGEWRSFEEMEYAEGDRDPFSEDNITKTKECLDQLYLKMAWDGKGGEISRILMDRDFAAEMFEKYGIELPVGM